MGLTSTAGGVSQDSATWSAGATPGPFSYAGATAFCPTTLGATVHFSFATMQQPVPSKIYLVSVSSSSLTPDELRAAAEVHSELGPGYRDAVVESFLDKIGKEIDARVDSRVTCAQETTPRKPPRDLSLLLAVLSIALGIPITAITLSLGHSGAVLVTVVAWVAIVFINVIYNRNHRPGGSGGAGA